MRPVVWTIASLFVGCAVAAAPTALKMTEEQSEACKNEGGCVLVTREKLKEFQNDAFDAGVKHQKVECIRFL